MQEVAKNKLSFMADIEEEQIMLVTHTHIIT